jgi:hypothetical protein
MVEENSVFKGYIARRSIKWSGVRHGESRGGSGRCKFRRGWSK